MADLRALFDALGHTDVRTYIQSGNVVFTRQGRHADPRRSRRSNRRIERDFGFDVTVLLRTPAELASVVKRNPFGADAYVTFLDDAARARTASTTIDPDAVRARRVRGRRPRGLRALPERLRAHEDQQHVLRAQARDQGDDAQLEDGDDVARVGDGRRADSGAGAQRLDSGAFAVGERAGAADHRQDQRHARSRRPRDRRPSTSRHRSPAASSPATRFLPYSGSARLLVHLGQRHEMLRRVFTARALRPADVLAVHHDLAERDVRGPGRLAVAHDDRVVARLHVGRSTRRVVAQIACRRSCRS